MKGKWCLWSCFILLLFQHASVSKPDQLRKTRVNRLNIQDHLLEMEDFEANRKNAADVTLDCDTAQPGHIISEDGKEVIYRDDKHDCYSKLQKLDDFCFNDLWFDLTQFGVLGKEGFTSGRHYWEVDVGKKTEWALGVAQVTNGKASQLSRGIGLREGQYRSFGKHCIYLYVKDKLEKVGISLDYEKGVVSYYNVRTKSHIYSFIELEFKEEVYPYFIPAFEWDEDNLAPLIITTVHDEF